MNEKDKAREQRQKAKTEQTEAKSSRNRTTMAESQSLAADECDAMRARCAGAKEVLGCAHPRQRTV